MKQEKSICALVPVYNNPMTIRGVVMRIQQYIDHVIVVDDGSEAHTRGIIDALATRDPEHIHISHLPVNQGKGAAVKRGLQQALELGFSHALQVDADGQHELEDIPRFLAQCAQTPQALISGAPIFGDDIPAVRKYGRKLTKLMVALEAGSLKIPDAMCGFRIYPVTSCAVLPCRCNRMCFDPEILIRAYWAGIPVIGMPTRVRYLPAEEGGVSHFRSWHDNLLNIGLHSRLLLQAPIRWLLRPEKPEHSA